MGVRVVRPGEEEPEGDYVMDLTATVRKVEDCLVFHLEGAGNVADLTLTLDDAGVEFLDHLPEMVKQVSQEVQSRSQTTD